MHAESATGSGVWPSARTAISTVARLAMAAVFVVAGLSKITDIELAKLSVESYQIFPREIAHVIGITLPVLEIALGALLLLGLGTRVVALLMSLLLIAFIAGIASLWIRDINVACGCFGGSILATERPNFAFEIGRDLLMLAATAWLTVWPRTHLALDDVLGSRTSVADGEREQPEHDETGHEYDEQLSGSSPR